MRYTKGVPVHDNRVPTGHIEHFFPRCWLYKYIHMDEDFKKHLFGLVLAVTVHLNGKTRTLSGILNLWKMDEARLLLHLAYAFNVHITFNWKTQPK